MGTVPIVIFRGLCISRAQGLGELGPPHFPVSRSAWYNPNLYPLYRKVLGPTRYTVQYSTRLQNLVRSTVTSPVGALALLSGTRDQ